MPILFSLDHEVRFYTPGTQGPTTKIKPEEQEERTIGLLNKFVDWFGGGNISMIRGGYKLESGGRVIEPNQVITSKASSDDIAKYRGDIIKLAEAKCKEWDQETIGVEIDGNMHFVGR